ncbi:MAG TPA: BACON domain-containing carbohydrate-binding protein [Ktedonobacteraceae bacterium]
MSLCLRCSKPCAPTNVFCDECRSLLRNQLQEGSISHGVNPLEEPLAIASSLPESDAAQDQNGKEPITAPQPITRDPQTPPPPTLDSYDNIAEQTISRLNEAARRIEEAEPPGSERKGRSYPHASRLAPMRDISAEIQRASTPLPKVPKSIEDEVTSSNPAFNDNKQVSNNSPSQDVQIQASSSAAERALKDADLPDLWPWLDSGFEDKEVDNWANQTDPLLSRHFPNSAESARIEEEDMRRAAAEGLSTAPFPIYRRPRQMSRLRMAFTALAIIAVLAMIVDGIFLLFAFGFGHSHHTTAAPSGPPALMLSSTQAVNGQTVKVTISHFTPQTKVLLTHDIQEAVQTTSASAIILIGSDGNATTSVIIDDMWGPGFHLLFAEDISTRYTASATLQIIGQGPTRPPRLIIQDASTPIDLGTAYQGANTIQNLTLLNAGGGSITWTASSNKAWLLISPPQGMFSKSQTIVIAAQRTGLKPGDYSGTITFTSNVGNQPPPVHVSMTVKQLPPNAGPVLSLTPAVLSFITSDGNPQPQAQNLTISNPGSQTLNWSVSLSDSSDQSSQNALGSQANWLSTNLSSGTIQPGSSTPLSVTVQSQNLLPGAYLGTLVFTGDGVIDSPQIVSISLTIQPHCGLIISPAGLSFIAVQGQGNPSNQALNLSLTNSCNGSIVTWHTISSNSWLAVAPANGQLRGAMSSVTSVGINSNGLPPRTYYGQITFVVGQSTQTVAVQLTVQPAPPPAEPIMSASPLNLNFSNTQGQPNPSGQAVTIANNGNGPLKWNTSINQLASSWLNSAPSGGTVAPKQTGQVTISVDTSTLTPGTYVGQVILDGKDIGGHEASGSPQTVTVNLVVQPPCVLTQPSSSALTFSYTQGGTNPSAQNVTFTGTGSCAWPLNWITAPSPLPAWLAFSSASGSIKASGDISTMQVSVNTTGLQPGSYTQSISISATDNSGIHAQGSPQTLAVTLIVQQPCSLQSLPASLTFTAVQGKPASPSSQSFSISEAGGCSYPVSWTAVGDTGSSTWLGISPTSGSNSGSGSKVTITISSITMASGTYTGQITMSATDSHGVAVQGTPQTIPVTLTIT